MRALGIGGRRSEFALAYLRLLCYNVSDYYSIRGSDQMISIYLSALDTQEEKDFFEDMYRNCRGKMYSIAYGVLGNREDAEDAVHIAFLKLADQLKNLLQKSRQDLKRYIVITIRNTSITVYNRNKKNARYDAFLNTENAEIEHIDINGHDAMFFMDNNGYYSIIWNNGEYIIQISANLNKDEFIDIAKSVQKVE